MARQLIILRHAKSAWNTDAPTDFDRPLAPRGLKAAPKMGRWMKKKNMIPDLTISSPAERARQTVTLASQAMGLSNKKIAKIKWDLRIYGADTEDFLEILGGIPQTVNRAMLVGHNPGLEDLVSYLVDVQMDGYDALITMKTATVAQLRMPKDWQSLSRGCAELIRLQHPRELPK
ncbi:SixA phosphatase family protein [Magnetococcales bacterium HHB-1]